MTLNAQNKDIKFPKRHYVGIVGRTNDNLPLAFLTEDGEDSAAKKRKSTVDGWVAQNSRGEKKIATARSMDNTPLIGFRLGRSVRRDSSWGSGNVKWRIEDPRGFELEIASPNMAKIVDSCVIDNGEILEECVWARLRGDNILVPVSSELYQAAQRNEERLASKVKPSEVERGDHVVLHNGTEGTYLGKFECYERNYRYREAERSMFEYQWKAKPLHAIVTTVEGSGSEPFTYVHTFATFKPSYLTKREGGPMSPEEAEKLAWEKRQHYSSEKLFLEKPAIQYEETPTTLEGWLEKEAERNGHLVCVTTDQRGEEIMYLVSGFAKWQYDEYIKNKNAPPATNSRFPTYRSDRLDVHVNKVTRTEDGGYRVHHPTGYSRQTLKMEELEARELRIVRAWMETSDGERRWL